MENPFDLILSRLVAIEELLKNQTSNSSTSRVPDITGYLSKKQVIERLKISLPTLTTWTKKGIIPGHRIGRRVLYKMQEVDAALSKINTK